MREDEEKCKNQFTYCLPGQHAVIKINKLIYLRPYTHAAISFDEKLDFLYSFARKYSALALPAGLVQEHLDKGCYAKTTQMPCALLEVKVNESDFERSKKGRPTKCILI